MELSAIVQMAGVAEVKLTVRPELAVAPTRNGDAPKIVLLKGANAIVWDAEATVKLRVTGGAAA
jgi:hypothetical protein